MIKEVQTRYTTTDAVYYTNRKMEEAMTDGHIPVNASDLPIEVPALPDDSVYKVKLKKFVLNPTRSKPKDGSEGVIFGKIQTEVVEGDFEGAALFLNYLPLPIPRQDEMSKAEQFKWIVYNKPFGRFCRAFKINDKIPPVDLLNPDEVNNFQDWISKYYDSEAQVTIRNQEFPIGSGKITSGINDFIF